MPLTNFLVEQVNRLGWLGISTLYFDNSYCINVFSSRGYVAYSPSKSLFFSFNCLDTTDTELIENTYDMMEKNYIGQQENLTVVEAEHLQHFDIAGYRHYNFYHDEDVKLPWVKIPTEAELNVLVKDEATGLYLGTDTVTKMNGKEVSTIGMYGKDRPYSGAIIDNWKRFYVNHAKMVQFVSEEFDITDAI